MSVSRALNVTTNNESTHCIFAQGPSGSVVVNHSNIAMVQLIDEAACARLSSISVGLQTIGMITPSGAQAAAAGAEGGQETLTLFE